MKRESCTEIVRLTDEMKKTLQYQAEKSLTNKKEIERKMKI